jgi:hypothetical protein
LISGNIIALQDLDCNYQNHQNFWTNALKEYEAELSELTYLKAYIRFPRVTQIPTGVFLSLKAAIAFDRVKTPRPAIILNSSNDDWSIFYFATHRLILDL